MPFVVRVASEKAGEEKFLEGRSTRKAAVAAARKLIGRGIEGVTLMDEDGRVCLPEEFNTFLMLLFACLDAGDRISRIFQTNGTGN
jgi:hypothetical protein